MAVLRLADAKHSVHHLSTAVDPSAERSFGMAHFSTHPAALCAEKRDSQR